MTKKTLFVLSLTLVSSTFACQLAYSKNVPMSTEVSPTPAIKFALKPINEKGKLIAEIEGSKKLTMIVRIINENKDILFIQHEEIKKGKNSLELDVSWLQEGKYTFKISDGKEEFEEVFDKK
jgi:hypothetical protein